jgi:hypothetical protein
MTTKFIGRNFQQCLEVQECPGEAPIGDILVFVVFEQLLDQENSYAVHSICMIMIDSSTRPIFHVTKLADGSLGLQVKMLRKPPACFALMPEIPRETNCFNSIITV